MSAQGFYLVCFLVGFGLSLVSFALHSFHLDGHNGHGSGGHAGHHHGGHAHHGGHGNQHAGGELSPLNMMTITAFLAWFGGTGYLLERYASLWIWLGVLCAAASGLIGAGLVFYLFRSLLSRERPLNPDDYQIVGMLGRVSETAHEGGTGEMIFSQEGLRKAAAIRSENGAALQRGDEVVVTRFEKGIAYVRRLDEFLELSSGH